MGQTALDIPKSGTLVVRIKMTVYGLWHLWLITGFGDAVFSVGSDRSLTFFAWVFGERNRSKEKHVFRMGLLPNRGCPHFSSCCLIDKYTYITYIIIYICTSFITLHWPQRVFSEFTSHKVTLQVLHIASWWIVVVLTGLNGFVPISFPFSTRDGKRLDNEVENHHFSWVNQLFRLDHF